MFYAQVWMVFCAYILTYEVTYQASVDDCRYYLGSGFNLCQAMTCRKKDRGHACEAAPEEATNFMILCSYCALRNTMPVDGFEERDWITCKCHQKNQPRLNRSQKERNAAAAFKFIIFYIRNLQLHSCTFSNFNWPWSCNTRMWLSMQNFLDIL